jgi:hypothetical protein
MQQISEPGAAEPRPFLPVQVTGRASGVELRVLLLLVPVLEAFGWSVVFGQPAERGLENALLAGVLCLWLTWLHSRWRLHSVISAVNWQWLLVVMLTIISLLHWRWLNEGTSEYGTGISDAHYVLDVLRGTADEYVVGYVGGYTVWLYLITTLFGMENYYAIALVSFGLICVGGLAVALVVRERNLSWRAVPVLLFMLHPYSIVLAATIYKDPLVICGTVLTFAGLVLTHAAQQADSVRTVRRPSLLLAAGLMMTLLGRPAFAFVLILFIGALFFVQALRQGRIGWRVLQLTFAAGVVFVLAIVASSYFDMLPVVLNSFRRIYDPTAAADLSVVSTGGYTADQASIGVRFLSGSISQRIALMPLALAMQLVSPFPPRLVPVESLYFWVEECFGLINLTLAPFLAVGTIAALRSRDAVLKLVPPYALFIALPAVAFGGVIGRQLAPIVPFLMILAWVGWHGTPRGPMRLLAILAIPFSWALAFGGYAYLRSL